MDTSALLMINKWAPSEQVVSKLVNFDFKRVFDEKSSQSEIFQRTALPIYDSVMHGYNGCIITYGQTGSGKTHTITGKTKDIEQMGNLRLTRHTATHTALPL